jgi:hypothetical protein
MDNKRIEANQEIILNLDTMGTGTYFGWELIQWLEFSLTAQFPPRYQID